MGLGWANWVDIINAGGQELPLQSCSTAKAGAPLWHPRPSTGLAPTGGPGTAQPPRCQGAASPIRSYSPPQSRRCCTSTRVHTRGRAHECKQAHADPVSRTQDPPSPPADISRCRRLPRLRGLWSPPRVDNPRQYFLNLLDITQTLLIPDAPPRLQRDGSIWQLGFAAPYQGQPLGAMHGGSCQN